MKIFIYSWNPTKQYKTKWENLKTFVGKTNKSNIKHFICLCESSILHLFNQSLIFNQCSPLRKYNFTHYMGNAQISNIKLLSWKVLLTLVTSVHQVDIHKRCCSLGGGYLIDWGKDQIYVSHCNDYKKFEYEKDK